MTDPLIAVVPPRTRVRRPPWALVAAAAIVAALWLFLHIASEVRDGGVLTVDRSLILAMRVPGHPAIPAGPAWLPSAMRDLTGLGGGPVLTMVVTAAAIFLALKRRWRTAAIVVVATGGGGWAVAALKTFFARPRPDLIDHLLVSVTSPSFPSGHAANSAIVYLTLAGVLFPVIAERRQRAFVLGAALILTGLIGTSRVYLGVHWPSDVLAGWLFGALWALGWWWVEARVTPRRTGAAAPL